MLQRSYSSGVYVKSAKAKNVGSHAVMLVGWGVESGVPYWLIQNSWGPNWGIGGFGKVSPILHLYYTKQASPYHSTP